MPRDRTTTQGPPEKSSSRRQPPPDPNRRQHNTIPTSVNPPRSSHSIHHRSQHDSSDADIDILPPPLPHSRRQPSAHLSEIGSVEENHFPSQPQTEELGDEQYGDRVIKYGPEGGQGRDQYRSRSRSTSRQSVREGNVLGTGGQGQAYAEEYRAKPIPEPKHPSAHRLAQAKEGSQSTRKTGTSTSPSISNNHQSGSGTQVGRSFAPRAFQPVSSNSTSRHGDRQPYSHSSRNAPPPALMSERRGPAQATSETIPSRRPYPPAGALEYPTPPKPTYSRSKLNISTKFDTPREKGGRGGSPASFPSSASRGSEGSGSYVPKPHRKRPPYAGASDTLTPRFEDTSASDDAHLAKRNRSRGPAVGTRGYTDIDLDVEVDGIIDLGDDGLEDDWEPEERDGTIPGVQAGIPPTPLSDRTGAGALVLAKKATILPSSDMDALLPDVDVDMDDDLAMLGEEIIDDGSLLKLKMPKTVSQVVKHMSTLLAKVSQTQGEAAIQSSESWDWTRLPVLASEIEGSIKEMEQFIHIAGQEKQAKIESTKRDRVDLEAVNTEQYEDFRGDFRDVCDKMQQPARLGKRYKFGPF